MADLELLEDYLDELDIKYFVANYLEGSDFEGYVCVYVDSNDFSIELLESMGFELLKPNLYVMETSDFKEVPDKRIEEIKQYFSEKYRVNQKKEELRKRIVELKEIWKKIGERLYVINLISLRDHPELKHEFFLPTLETLRLAFKLPYYVVTDEVDLHQFCCDVFLIAHEAIHLETFEYLKQQIIKKIPEVQNQPEDKRKKAAFDYLMNRFLGNDIFYQDIHKTRHFFTHIKGREIKKPKEKCFDEFRECINNRSLARLSCDFDYYLFQLRLLRDFLTFLNNIESILHELTD